VTSHGPARGASQPVGPDGAPRIPEHPGGRPRPAHPGDVPEILRLVRELAEYERSLAEVSATEELLHDLLFGGNTPSGAPAAHCHVIDGDPGAEGGAARLAGMALWFLNASTWLGRHGIYLEDLYVRPQYRGRGYGQALMATLAAICVERGYARLEWWVLDWNAPAIGFYESLGARAMDEWTVHRITGAELDALAGQAPA
jgi:GNAT superfamily N-acetyltransferase